MERQKQLIELISEKIKGKKSIGRTLMDVLDISRDAAYRRYRLETEFSIGELIKIQQRFNISLDGLLGNTKNTVLFNYRQESNEFFSLEAYLHEIQESLEQLSKQEKPCIILTINNTPFFQLFHFPSLLRFKLYFWTKNLLQVKALQKIKFKDFYFSMELSQTAHQILCLYNKIPSVELYDPDLLRGFAREVYYYYDSKEIDADDAQMLYMDMLSLLENLKLQADNEKKQLYQGKSQPFNATFEMYHNEMLNAIAMFYYEAKGIQGLSVTHNFLNPLFTDNHEYVSDSKKILDQLIRNSQKISGINKKGRNQYFAQIEKTIKSYQAKLKANVKIADITE